MLGALFGFIILSIIEMAIIFIEKQAAKMGINIFYSKMKLMPKNHLIIFKLFIFLDKKLYSVIFTDFIYLIYSETRIFQSHVILSIEGQ